MVASGESYRIKLRSVSSTTQRIVDALDTDVQTLQAQLASDQKIVYSVQQKIAAGRNRSLYEVEALAIASRR